MKQKSAISLLVVILLVAGWGYLALNGAQIGAYDILPYQDGISLGLDLQGGVYVVYQANLPPDSGDLDYAALVGPTIASLQKRLSDKGYTEATVSRQGYDRIRVEIPDVDDPKAVLDIIGTPGRLEFKEPDGTVIMDGNSIRVAEARMQTSGSNVVLFQLNDTGTTLFAEATARLQGQSISIELDGEVISSPTVNTVITEGSGYIEGDMSFAEAENLAMLIMSGALPLVLEQLEVRTISATLGVDALSTSLLAGMIGMALLVAFMIVVYRLPGLMASLALGIYLLIDLFLIAVVPGVQMTLPGIAGLILSIGMAIDANIIIFERIKEELRRAKTLRASVEAGFKNALPAILDSNITTLIAAVVLGFFGTGSVQGFAITLGIGVLASMFTAIVVTRFLLRRMVGLEIVSKALYGVSQASIDAAQAREAQEPANRGGLSVMRLFKPMCGVFAVLFLAGIVLGAVFGGFNMGIDFAGGTMITFQMGGDFNADDVSAEFAKLGVSDVSVAKTGEGGVDDTALVRMRDLNDPDREDQLRADAEANLQAIYPDSHIVTAERVGAVAGQTLILNAVLALLITLVLMSVYIWFRFEMRSGVSVVVALAVTAAALLAFVAISRVQINSPFIAVILTVVGYSINNIIVIFDRIRENNRKMSASLITRGELTDISVRESMARTINTTATTLFMLVTLYVLGVPSIQEFALPIIVGLIAGVVASIFIAPPIWGLWMQSASQRKLTARKGNKGKRKTRRP